MSALRTRRPISKTSLHHRSHSLNAIEQLQYKRDLKTLRTLILIHNLDENTDLASFIIFKWSQFNRKYKYDPTSVPRTIKFKVCIANIADSDCYNLFRFRKPDLVRLHQCLNMPATVVLSNRSTLSSEEVFLFSLRRLASTANLDELVATSERPAMFDRDYSQWSRAFHYFLDHIFNRFAFLLLENLEYFLPSFPLYARAIAQKIHHVYDPDNFDIVGFIDGTIRPISRVGSGPPPPHLTDEERCSYFEAHSLLQRTFYTGYKKLHGLKWISADFPDGLTGFLYGPVSARRSDRQVFNMSELATYMENLQSESETNYKLFGDSIFPTSKCIVTNRTLEPHTEVAQEALASVRISIEWDFGSTLALFPHLSVIKKMQLLKSPLVLIYFAATLLRNCHTCSYGSCSSAYFGLTPPSLESYLRCTPLT